MCLKSNMLGGVQENATKNKSVLVRYKAYMHKSNNFVNFVAFKLHKFIWYCYIYIRLHHCFQIICVSSGHWVFFHYNSQQRQNLVNLCKISARFPLHAQKTSTSTVQHARVKRTRNNL